jgi:hypothetical protein
MRAPLAALGMTIENKIRNLEPRCGVMGASGAATLAFAEGDRHVHLFAVAHDCQGQIVAGLGPIQH